MIRITGGQSRGRAITGPAGLEARPTASKIRQAFFNILIHKVQDARFLDLCAGTGLMGLEALSRGAAELVAVEQNRQMVRAIEANLKHLGYEAEVITGDIRRVLPVLEEQSYDIIFADPPYKSRLGDSVLASVSKHNLLAPNGILAIEHARDVAPPEESEELQRYDRRDYGQTSISFYHSRR